MHVFACCYAYPHIVTGMDNTQLPVIFTTFQIENRETLNNLPVFNKAVNREQGHGQLHIAPGYVPEKIGKRSHQNTASCPKEKSKYFHVHTPFHWHHLEHNYSTGETETLKC